jgi:hypothetical protein
MNQPSYEILGKFYLGREYDLGEKQLRDIDILYDSKDLVTHALCVGMTGSGKTGLCLSLLEEAVIDGIPAICIDPKGDLGNLLLSFPDFKGSDFQPWIEPSEATRKGLSIEDLAEKTATMWKDGLEKWGQSGERVRMFREKADISIYTPGSNIGIPLTVLKSFDAPSDAVLEDIETLRERVSSAASGLLTLLGMDSDPLTSRPHILLSKIFDTAWNKKQNLDLGELIRQIQSPPIEKIGVIDLETFMPTAERVKLAMTLNNLLASPAFAGWLEGEPLDIKRLLYTSSGNPRLSIISIAHLNDSERMFFVTILLGELLSWMRSQPGTSSLRALFYMDEVYGYFPPSAKPPSKPPMLTLLKQARAFGLGIMLATQNPMDLDYKGLANMGTWFLGRLQTQRDKDRVLDGLEGASAQAGQAFDRAAMDRSLSALGARVFLLNNVHSSKPEIFQSRWALSFLKGPLSRDEIQKLMKEKRAASAASIAKFSTSASGDPQSKTPTDARPIVPANVEERFLLATKRLREGAKQVYRPAVLGQSSLHYVQASLKVDHWMDSTILLPVVDEVPDPFWETAVEIPADTIQLSNTPESNVAFSPMPVAFSSAKNFTSWEKDLKDHLFRNASIKIFQSKALKRTSKPGQSEEEARIELSFAAKEARDQATAALTTKYEEKLRALRTKITAAQQKLEKEKSEANSQWLQTSVSVATSVLGALLGNKVASKSNMTKIGTAAKGFGKASTAGGDVARAAGTLQELQEAYEKLELECETDVLRVSNDFSAANMALEEVDINARKSDTRIKLVALAWVPWQIDPNGIATPLVDLPDAYVRLV